MNFLADICAHSCKGMTWSGLWRPSALATPGFDIWNSSGQGIWMLLAEHLLSRLYDLHLQLFGLLPSPLVPVCRCEVGHAGQGIWMLFAEYPLPRL